MTASGPQDEQPAAPAAAVASSPDPGRPAAVEFAGVSKVYGAGTPRQFVAIKDVSFSIPDLAGRGVPAP